MSGTYNVDTSFDNPAPTIQQGSSVIATGIFYDPTPADTANRDEIAVFTFDTIDLPSGVTLEGLRNANSRPVALLSKDAMTVGGLIDCSGEQGQSGPDWNFIGGAGGAAGPGGGGGGGGGGTGQIDIGRGFGGSGGAGFVPGQPGEDWPFGATFTHGGAGGSVEAGSGGTDLGSGGGAGGGAFGGNGGAGFTTFSPGGTAYGDLSVRLEGGSGGAGSGAPDFYVVYDTGGVNFVGSGGGGGGGAVELGAVTSLVLSGHLTARGGAGGPRSVVGPAGGAGGGVLLHAISVVLDSDASIDASGGAGDQKGGGGGGGRILLVANTITTADLATAINLAGGAGGSLEGGPGSNGVLSTIGTVHTLPKIVCPQSRSISCAPASGLAVTLSVAVSDPDSGETLTITLKEGSTVLDTKSASTPAADLLVTFDAVVLSATPHALTVEVTDGILTSSCTAVVTVDADTDSPTITACSPNQSANATSPTGAVVNYPNAIASDNCAPPALTYSNPSGSLFSIGETIVTVTATDVGGNQVTCTFNVHIKGATEQLSDLSTYLAGLSIDSGTKVSLQAKLITAQTALAARNPQNALTALQDLINAASAQKGKKLTAAQADHLISDATRIRAVIPG